MQITVLPLVKVLLYRTFLLLGDLFYTRANIIAPKLIPTVLKHTENGLKIKFVHFIYTAYLVKGFCSKNLVKGLHYQKL